MAAALFEHAARRHGDSDLWIVESAGTWAMDGQPATGHAQTMMAQRELDIRKHRAHTITREDVESSDVVIVMTENHRQALVAEFPAHRHKIHLLGEVDGSKQDVADPYGGSLPEYKECANELERLIELGYPLIKSWSDSTTSLIS